jgi:hypothetical protein
MADNVEKALTALAQIFDEAGDELVFTGTDVADVLRGIIAKLPTFRRPAQPAETPNDQRH